MDKLKKNKKKRKLSMKTILTLKTKCSSHSLQLLQCSLHRCYYIVITNGKLLLYILSVNVKN